MSAKEYDFRKVDNIRVIGRFRPSNENEQREEKKQHLTNTNPVYRSKQQVELARHDKPQNYRCTLDHIFKTTTTQKQVFNIVGRPMVQACLEGYNATIFAYGQTGSGKTYTMFGPEKRSNDTQLGLVQRCATYLFDKLRKRTVESAKADDENVIKAWQISAEFIQVYKDQLSDLLAPKTNPRSLQIKTNFQTDTPYVENLKSVSLNTVADLIINLSEAHRNRIVASHKLNSTSSRSHMLLMLTLEQQMADGSIKRSKLNFGDLAGSEDVRKALGDNPDKNRLREAIAINSSLTALTTAITMLTKKQRPSYRSSPLTHILQDSLGGNSKTTMIVAASPHILNRPETIRTLRFAESAKHVKNRARINKQETRAQLLKRIQELEQQNSKLKTRVIELEMTMKEAGLEVTLTKGLYDDASGADSSSGSDVSEDEDGTTSNSSATKPKFGRKGKLPVKGGAPAKQITASKNNNTKTKAFDLSVGSATAVNLQSSGPQQVELSTDIQRTYHRFSQTHSIPSLLKQIDGLQSQIAGHNDTVSGLRDNNRQLEIEIESLTQQMHSLKDDVSAQIKSNEILAKENKDCHVRIDQITAELSKANKDSNKQQSDLDKQIQRLRNNVQMQLGAKTDLQKQAKQLNIQNENLLNENVSLRDQLAALKQQVAKMSKNNKNGKNDAQKKNEKFDIKDDELGLKPEEKNFTPAELLLHRFADIEATDVRLTPEQRMKKTSKMMGELSYDISGLMDKWLPAAKVRKDRKRSEALVFQVRQLIGHFNVLYGQLQEQKGSFQNDLKLDIQRKNNEIKRLKDENSKVLQLRDDLAEKDDIIGELKKQISQLNQEKDLLRGQTEEQQDMIRDAQQQVVYLTREIDRSRSTITFGSQNLPLNLLSPQSHKSQTSEDPLELGAILDGDENSESDSDIYDKPDGKKSTQGTTRYKNSKTPSISPGPSNKDSTATNGSTRTTLSRKKNGKNGKNGKNTKSMKRGDSEDNTYDIESVSGSDADDESFDEKKDDSKRPSRAHGPNSGKNRMKKPKPKARKSTATLWRENLNKGDKLDCRDTSGLWWTAQIVGIKGQEFKIRYDGYGEEYDEYVNKNSKRLAIYKSRFANKKNNRTIIKEGYMQKEGKMFRTWRKRYFVLFEDGEMCYYREKNEENSIGKFNVKGTKNAEKASFGRKGKQHGLQFETAERVWKFICENDQDVSEWIESINHVMLLADYQSDEEE